MTLFFLSPFPFPLSPAFANDLGNGGFESDIGNGTGGNWDATNGAVRVTTATLPAGGFSAVPEGTFALYLDNATDFTFQTFDNVRPGDFVEFSALVESDVAVGGGAQGGQVRIEFKRLFHDTTDQLIFGVNSALITIGSAPAGAGYVRFSASGVAPPETGRVVFVLRGTGGAVGDLVFDSAVASVNPGKLQATASKGHAKAGEVVTIFTKITNATPTAYNNVNLTANISPGLDFLPQSVRLNGRAVGFREGSLIIPIGTLAANANLDASFQVLVTTSATVGRQHEISLALGNALDLAERSSIRIIVEEDPVFDQGTILGKVFNDSNQNGQQDEGEKGVPWVRLATEEGILIVTDEEGRYHIPGVKAGRHVVKIDAHSLPQGTKFITEETFLVKTTPGLMNKASFAVLLPPSSVPESFQKDLTVMITQGLDTSRPDLEVTMSPELIRTVKGPNEKQRPEKDVVFKFDINYPEFVKLWRLEVRDEMGREVWTGFGVAAPPVEVLWSGQTEPGMALRPGIYSYQLKVEDKASREDWTALKFFRVVFKEKYPTENPPLAEIPPVGDFNIFKDGKRTIPLVAKPTIRVQGKTRPGYKVSVNGRPINSDSQSGMFQSEFYVTPGEKEILVSATSPEGEMTSTREIVKVKDSMFFMTALGEEQLGVNFQDGDIEAAGNPDLFRNAFYQDGRLSYYLRGKLKGKFLVKSHYDTSDKRSALFTNLDPEDYYPIYGDNSQRDYEAADSRQRFFIVVEMERSFVKWGSFQTKFTESELATYDRSLSGLKINYETLGSTTYGDPKRGFKLFSAKAGHRADHNEFAATGGSLYYLRNRRVIEGSEKIRVEVRDKLQDISLDSTDLEEGKDYEIDYDEGRIMLTRALSSVAASDTLASRDILDGNPVYLIVDYEFDDDPSAFESDNRGLRGYTHLGDHVRMGVTAIEEKRQNVDYDLRGIDTRLRLGRNTQVTAEYAESTNQQTQNSVSYNGGLSFRDAGPLKGRRKRQSSYLIKGETKPVKNLDTSAYIQTVEPGYSTASIPSQEGLKKYGGAAKYKFSETFSLRYRFDFNEVHTQLRPLTERGVRAPFEKVQSHTAQAVYDDKKWLVEGEYLRQTNDPAMDPFLNSTLLSEIPFENAVAGKVGYHFNDRLLPYIKSQTVIEGKAAHYFGGGVRVEVLQDVFAYIEQLFGKMGDSTLFGVEKFHDKGARSYVNLKSFDRGIGAKTLSTAVGSSFSLTEKTRVYSEREHSTYQAEEGAANIYGAEGKVGDRWDFDAKFERRHLDNSMTRRLDIQAGDSLTRTNSFNTLSGAVGYAVDKKFRVRTAMEVRRDQDTPRLWQWVTRNSAETRINQDLALLGKLDYGKSRFANPDDTPAAFTELSAGFAYRPVDNDRLNLLARYTFVKNIANDLQFSTPIFQGLETDEAAHLWAIDLAYDLYKTLGMADKLAYKKGIFETGATDEIVINTILLAHRFNFHVTRKWDVALEYRALWQAEAADSLRHGPLVEVDREFYDYVRLGLGYNFTDFDDDLRDSNDFNSHGPFVRMTGKF